MNISKYTLANGLRLVHTQDGEHTDGGSQLAL